MRRARRCKEKDKGAKNVTANIALSKPDNAPAAAPGNLTINGEADFSIEV